jgi:type I restriction enzyme, S subunit
MKYKAYKNYADGINDWIGEIPEHWKFIKLKFTCEIKMGQSPDSNDYIEDIEALPFLQGNADFNKLYPTASIYCNTANKVAFRNEILLSVRAPIGALNIADREYGIGRGLCSINPKNIYQKYLYYQLLFKNNELNSIGTGSTFTAISIDEIKNLSFIIPPLPEQHTIAAFLDRETARIDALIDKKQKLIALLKEKRTALITRAVTKGIGALSGAETPKMKPSGIEWLGEIPEHWEVKRMRYLVQITTGEKDTENREDYGEYPFYVRSQTVERISTYSYDGEAILTAGDGVGVCKVWHHVNAKFDFHQRVYMLYKFRGVTGRFLFYFLKELFIHEVLKLSAKSTVDSLRLHMFQNFPAAVPNSIIEQRRIGDFLDAKTRKIDVLVLKVNHAIAKLREYRTALISAAVTGKVRVGSENI